MHFRITCDVSRIVSRIVSHSNLLNIVRVGRGITKYCQILSEIIEIFSGKAGNTHVFFGHLAFRAGRPTRHQSLIDVVMWLNGSSWAVHRS